MAQHQPVVVALFKERADAHKAVAALVEAGFARTSAQVMPEEGASTSYTRSGTTTSYDHMGDEGGFWSSLGSLPLPDEDRYAYAEGMSRGGVTVSLTVDDEARAAEATDILERYGAVDLDQMEESWRSEGWAGYTPGTTTTTTTTTTSTSAGAALAGTAGTASLGAAQVRGDGVVERAEERLVVGKRQAAGGRVRVRSYVVETPFEEQVTLQQERIHVERRPVDRPVQPGDAVFEERVIEASERSEEAVVTKEARVVEEIGLRKEADTRTETVRDTVRRQEVEVEDDRTAGGVTGSRSTTTTVETDMSRSGGGITGRDRR